MNRPVGFSSTAVANAAWARESVEADRQRLVALPLGVPFLVVEVKAR
jgi:hypothetical protein